MKAKRSASCVNPLGFRQLPTAVSLTYFLAKMPLVQVESISVMRRMILFWSGLLFLLISANIAKAEPPVASDQTKVTDEDTAVTITLSATDQDGDSLFYALGAQPANGALSGTAPELTYTPNANFHGSDNFTFLAIGGSDVSNIGTVSITVNPVNDVPVANAQGKVTDEDTAVTITLTGSDAEGETLSYAVVAQPANGTLSGTAPGLTYTPNANFNGADSFTFKANDGNSDSSIATVTITVNPVNDPPVAQAGQSQVIYGVGTVTLNGSGLQR